MSDRQYYHQALESFDRQLAAGIITEEEHADYVRELEREMEGVGAGK